MKFSFITLVNCFIGDDIVLTENYFPGERTKYGGLEG